MQQKLPVPFHAENRRINYLDLAAAQGFYLLKDFGDRALLRGFVFYDAAPADIFPANFKLRFDQDHKLAAGD